MSSVEQGLKTGSDVLMWLLNMVGAVIGFCLPFIILGFIAFLLIMPIMMIGTGDDGTE